MKKLFKNQKALLFVAVLSVVALTLNSCAKKNGFECPNRISIQP